MYGALTLQDNSKCNIYSFGVIQKLPIQIKAEDKYL